MDDDRERLLQTIERLGHQLDELKQTIESIRRSVDAPAALDTLVPLKSAACHTGFSVETVRLWLARGRVAGKRRGGRWHDNLQSLQRQLDHRARA